MAGTVWQITNQSRAPSRAAWLWAFLQLSCHLRSTGPPCSNACSQAPEETPHPHSRLCWADGEVQEVLGTAGTALTDIGFSLSVTASVFWSRTPPPTYQHLPVTYQYLPALHQTPSGTAALTPASLHKGCSQWFASPSSADHPCFHSKGKYFPPQTFFIHTARGWILVCITHPFFTEPKRAMEGNMIFGSLLLLMGPFVTQSQKPRTIQGRSQWGGSIQWWCVTFAQTTPAKKYHLEPTLEKILTKQKATPAVLQNSFCAQALFCLPFQAEGSLTSTEWLSDKYRITCFPISVYLQAKTVNCLV